MGYKKMVWFDENKNSKHSGCLVIPFESKAPDHSISFDSRDNIPFAIIAAEIKKTHRARATNRN